MRERVLAFGEGGRLVGTLCLPDGDVAPGGVGQILFNAGIVHRVGPHRLNVKLARRLAARGIASLRFDLSGLGDSGRAPGADGFDVQAPRDLRAAMDALAGETGLARFSLFGFCSGGRHAYATAPLDARVAGLILYDTFAFPTWRSRLNRYGVRIRHDGLAGAVLGRLRRLAGAGAAVAETSGDGSFVAAPTHEAFAERVRALLARGTKVGVIHSGEGANYNYEGQFRDAFRGTGLDTGVTLDYLPAMDHTVMDPRQQALLLERLESWIAELDARRPAAAVAR